MKILIAAGGTGGHIYPGLAIAEKIKTENPGAEIVFIGSMVGMEKNIIPQYGYPIEYIRVRGFERKASLETLAAIKGIFDGLSDAKKLIKKHQPDLVIGTGGFTAGPLLLIASRRKIKTMIHEQNAYPGKTNLMLGTRVNRIAISFKEAEKYFPQERTFLAGNPVRSDYHQIDRSELRKNLNLSDTQKMILIMGGSQGAGSINQSALSLIASYKDQDDRVIYHLTGKDQYESIKKEVDHLGLSPSGHVFVDAYSNEMHRLLGAADLVISRSGAMSVAEIQAVGVPSILVPYPLAAGNHQEFNARVITDPGGGVLIKDKELTGARLIQTVESLLEDEKKCQMMSQITKKQSIINAGDRIYAQIKKLMENE
ncbi:undecaprenyldiphospho-muramoylpentapeptide beta-N-acetylglucosaminyltransferase [Acetobacterium sp. K1/6]|uniref:undecaprenyldiphospho-muramoylpentapeptide beta-N-acetylglucosaminyltransferase n=1 Tax=Acetobacterium sp. K1/6 TaxID=3055467 RepID=UPI002ACA30A1|nr:undecaprenyldiphospho-muramoylpentapeptide beta-N-acetylglucosaminyltransferase [Acetobacterium sp. K1/6]MDZ5726489.1 undecaprenyldiphospho-muramoylpentapeptide beta-N-acetylglucosaminyltransferase [Acetobacterium sp. K1/6]